MIIGVLLARIAIIVTMAGGMVLTRKSLLALIVYVSTPHGYRGGQNRSSLNIIVSVTIYENRFVIAVEYA